MPIPGQPGGPWQQQQHHQHYAAAAAPGAISGWPQQVSGSPVRAAAPQANPKAPGQDAPPFPTNS